MQFERVFPAHAGMFLAAVCVGVFLDCFPRARGDVPELFDVLDHMP